MTNYNQLGHEYDNYLAASGVIAYGTLSDEAASKVAALRETIMYRRSTSWNLPLTNNLAKLLFRLDAVFYYSAQINKYLQDIRELPFNIGALGANIPDKEHFHSPPLCVTRDHKELTIAFESLIFHSVTVLDTFANLCVAHCNGCKLKKDGKPVRIYFSNVQDALKNSIKFDNRANDLIKLRNECVPTLERIALNAGKTKTTLRNRLAHEMSISDLTKSNFVIHWLEDGKVLRFDHDVYEMPLVGSARNLIQTVSYLVIKSVTKFLETSDLPIAEPLQILTRELFEPSWTNPLISWRDYISENSDDPDFTFYKTGIDGFSIQNVNLKPDVFTHAV